MKKRRYLRGRVFILGLLLVAFLLTFVSGFDVNQRMVRLNVQLNTQFMRRERIQSEDISYKYIESIQPVQNQADSRVMIKSTADDDINAENNADDEAMYGRTAESRVTVNKTDSDNGRNTFELHYTGGKPLKIMQITDLHISGDTGNHEVKNVKAMKTVYEMVLKEQPDFIVVTGDLVFGMPYSDTEGDFEALRKALSFMEKLGVAWTWAFGNHDHDFLDRLSYEEIEMFMSSCSTLYMPQKDMAVKGYSNSLFKIYRDNKLESALVIMDTHNGIYENDILQYYDSIDSTQTEWYKRQIEAVNAEAGTKIPTFVYLHIPLEEYALENEIISGELREAVGCSIIHNDFVETVKELGSTRAIMCGHDHLNDAIMRSDDLLLIYSKSIDYTAYEGIENQHEQRGMCRLLLYKDGGYSISNVQY